MMGGYKSQFIEDKSTHFNLYDCNIGLQGNLNELAKLLTEKSKGEEAKELENTAKALEGSEKCKGPEELKKNGTANRLKRLVDELEDQDSGLHKAVKAVKNGIGIAQDIAKGYNAIAEWTGLPQVPKPFLK